MTNTPERTPAEEHFNAAIDRLFDVYGGIINDLTDLLESVRDDGTIHITDNEASECVADCTGCLTERLAFAVVRAVNGDAS